MYKTIEQFVGNTPLVKLRRLPGETSNTVLLKLEGNNPAGSVKDRPALSMKPPAAIPALPWRWRRRCAAIK
jgi:cysteine synthase B